MKNMDSPWITKETVKKEALKKYKPTNILFGRSHKWYKQKDAVLQELITTSLCSNISLHPKNHKDKFLEIPKCKKSSPELIPKMFARFQSFLKINEVQMNLFNTILHYERIFFPFLSKKDKKSHARRCNKLNLHNRLLLEVPIATGVIMSIYQEIAQHNCYQQEVYHHTFPHILQSEYDKYINTSWLQNTLNQNVFEDKSYEMMNQGSKRLYSAEVGHRLLEVHKSFSLVGQILEDASCIFEDTSLNTIIDMIKDGTYQSLVETERILKEIFPFASHPSVQESLRRLIPVYMDIAKERNIMKDTSTRFKETCSLHQILGKMESNYENEVTDEFFPEKIFKENVMEKEVYKKS